MLGRTSLGITVDMRVALIQSGERLSQGDLLALARVLRRGGHEVTLVVPQTGSSPSTPVWADQWRAEGFAWLPVSAARLIPPQNHFPRDATLATARALSDIVEAFDAAWFFEHHWAMPTLRDRRFRNRLLPLVVLGTAPDPHLIPTSLEEINRASSCDYAVQWADAILAGESGIATMERLWVERLANLPRAASPPSTTPAVTVCIPYFEAPDFLSELLQSLERQTSQNFTVVAVDDGSYSAKAMEAFRACADQYATRGWKFLRQQNSFPGAARNRAAREANTEFLLFIDSDDVAMPPMVDRFLRAALLTGDDCLVAPNYGFRDDPEGACTLLYDPPGGLIGSMCDDMHGGSCIFVRRESFWRIGGFTEISGVGFEDYEFHVRCQLEGLRWDVLPDFVYRYRMPRLGGISQSTAQYSNQARVLRWYEDRLQTSGLRQLPLALAASHWRLERASSAIGDMQNAIRQRAPTHRPRPEQVKLLLLTCYFPFGITSGWHRRVREMIRYFGSRYEVTLVAPMVREQLAPVKREAFRYLKGIYGVEGSNRTAEGGDELPFRVRQHYTDTFRAALEALPTGEYHAALIEQIFMAEFRNALNCAAILSEQNIESGLLRQTSERAWPGVLPVEYRNARAESLSLEQYENRVWPEFPLRAVVSEADRAIMNARVNRGSTNRGSTVIAANGADLSSWLPHAKRSAMTILFPAHLSYLPNVDAVEFFLVHIWPLVKRRTPRARLILAGREPSEQVKAAVAAATGVELCANPVSMDKVARRASITVAPLRLGSGTRCKILESMAWGLPVVSTTLGAEGIAAEDGEHLLIRDDPDAFAEAVCQLFSDEILWQKLRAAGWELVRERYSWDKVFEPLEDALLELIA